MDRETLEAFRKILINIGGGSAAVGASVGSVAASGVSGLSAVGISTGLAALGIGSMAVGIGSVALIGAGTFVGVKKLLQFITKG